MVCLYYLLLNIKSDCNIYFCDYCIYEWIEYGDIEYPIDWERYLVTAFFPVTERILLYLYSG